MIAQTELLVDRIKKGTASTGGSMNNLLPMLIEVCSEGDSKEEKLENTLLNAASEISVVDTLRREVNTAKALLLAEGELQNDTQEPPAVKVDDDWLFRWRDSASEVSSEEIQYLWGKVLAGEVKAPGSFSLRTLEFIRNLSTQEAINIAILSQFNVAGIIYRDAKQILQDKGVTFDFLLNMQDIGILSGVDSIGLSMEWKSLDGTSFKQILTSNSMALILTGDNPDITISLPMYKLTSIGQQVLRLGKFGANNDYLKKIGEQLKNQEVNVVLAKYNDIAPGEINYFEGFNL